MKLRSALPGLALVLWAASLRAAEIPIAPMPELPPPLSAGVNSAAHPAPQFYWFQQVKEHLEQGRAAAAATQVVFDGDSITAGWPTTGAAVWNERYAKYHPFDFAIAGDSTQHLLWRLAQGQAAGMHPRLVVLLAGINNIYTNTPEEIAAGLQAVVAAYRARCPDAVILLQGLFPSHEKPDDPVRAKIKQVNALISRFADGRKVVFVDFGDKFLQPDGTLSREILPDFLHPSEKGYRIWADSIQPFIDRYLAAP